MFLKKLAWYRKESQKYWQAYFATWQKQAREISPLSSQMLDKFIDLYPRGKQLRGFLVYLGYKIAGGKNDQQILKASVSLEILETSILLIDDVFDQDKKRRGIDTIYIAWQKQLQNHSNSKFLGENMATITMMNGYYMVVENLLQADFSAKTLNKALSFLSKAAILTGYGEAMDVVGFKFNKNNVESFDDLDKINFYKTSWYTIIMPLRFGLILAGVDQQNSLHNNLSDFGKLAGELFQIKDDLLGTFGDSSKTGKSNNSDIAQRRWTSLVKNLYLLIKDEDKSKFLDIFEGKVSKKKTDLLYQLLIDYDIESKLAQKMQKLLRECQLLADNMNCDQEYKQILREFSEYLLNRDY